MGAWVGGSQDDRYGVGSVGATAENGLGIGELCSTGGVHHLAGRLEPISRQPRTLGSCFLASNR